MIKDMVKFLIQKLIFRKLLQNILTWLEIGKNNIVKDMLNIVFKTL